MIKLNGKEVKFGKFPNGEINIDVCIGIYKDGNVNRIEFKFEDNNDIYNLILLRKIIKEMSFNSKCFLEIAYMPYSRMDRYNDSYFFILKYVCQTINELKFESVTVNEPHSDVTPALINNCLINFYTPELLEKVIVNERASNLLIIFPDIGASKRYSSIFYMYEQITAHKERDFSTGSIKSLKILEDTNIQGKDIVIIDDLCSRGGTFMLTATKLKELGAKDIYLVVGHCENTIFDGEILKTDLIKKVYTTNTIINRTHEKIYIQEVI